MIHVLNQNLKRIREAAEMTQTEVAYKLNITRQAYNHYETGKREPTVETLIKLADLFHVSTDYLLGRQKEPETPSYFASTDHYITLLCREAKHLNHKNRQILMEIAHLYRTKQENESHADELPDSNCK